MIWDIVFWLALAYLAYSIFMHFFVSGSGRTAKRSGSEEKAAAGGAKTWLWPGVAIVIMAVSFGMKANPDLFKAEWTPENREMVDHFDEAILLYEQASAMISVTGRIEAETWESVNALLQAASMEAEMVPVDILDKLHPDLREHFQNEFMAGLQAGVYGLQFYTAGQEKGVDTLEHNMIDSLDHGRALLGQWTEWFMVHKQVLQYK